MTTCLLKPGVSFALVVAMTLVASGPLLAHGDQESRLHDIDHRIEESPRDARLYLRRGRILRDSAQWQQALAQYRQALALDPLLAEALFWQADAMLGLNDPGQARHYVEAYLEQVPGSSKGWRLLAETCRLREDYAAGVAVLDKAIRLDELVPPQTFLNRAYLQARAGVSAKRILAGYDHALVRFPGNIAVIDRALSLAQREGLWERAEDYWQQIPDTARQQPKWLLRRANLSAAQGKGQQARVFAAESLSAWQALPSSRRQSPAMRNLRSQIDRMLVAGD
ncbi:tetratricopeptide repeat protein [Spongiibacter taiwanensis]|uniref:tetratricopeptide repeat protein n=1 Tax=Spongiibacter taiwanensis TaxID=1748242 RepID=UPI00203618E1|nr:tetratricopeptide repeat protein [Spongiibacter taiwanensis]USA42322.1 tetratricopeptide repeat protein [Spongiibacter taiwanensis]